MIKKSLLALTALATIAAGSIKATAQTEITRGVNLSGIYPAVFQVYEIDREYDILYLMTPNGHDWEYKGIEDYMVGDITTAIMYDNGTPDDITDDIILNMRYAGYIDKDIK